jgi:hypothetical protein
MRLTERNPKSQRSAERLSTLVRRRAVFGLMGVGQWTAGKPVSGASACAADRTISVPFAWSLNQSIVEATNRKAGCGRSACPVWMGRDVNSRFLSISLPFENVSKFVFAVLGGHRHHAIVADR